MMKNSKKFFAFTLAEVMVTLMVISIILSVLYTTTKHRVDGFDNKYMTYSAYNSLKTAVGEVKADGCTDTDVSSGYCESKTSIPSVVSAEDGNNRERGFCDRVADYLNKTSAIIHCAPQAVPAGTTDFTSQTPNFITTNGMAFYNMGGTLSNGYYTVYVDIDGSTRRKSQLNSDVLAFYVTTDGLVVPAKDSIAANSVNYLPTSVFYIANGQKNYEVLNSTFMKAYCTAYGQAGAGIGSYCMGTTTVPGRDVHGNPTSTTISYPLSASANCRTYTCQLEVNKPSFFWAK